MCSRNLFFLFCCVFIPNSLGCSSGHYPYEKYLGSRTPYRLVANESFDQINFEGCVPEKIWMVIRHGTRNPSAPHIELMKERLPEIKDLILESNRVPNDLIRNRDLDLFRKWNTKLDTDDNTKLVHEGEEELLAMAERMQSRFPSILDIVYSNTSYKFKYTYSQRTRKSALNFAAGLFGKKTSKDVWFPEPLKKDPILRFYKNCKKWNSEIKRNPEANKEATLFRNGEEMKRTVKNVNDRLGLSEKLSIDDVKAMYVTCSFETAWNKLSKSPWCSVFSVEDLKVLEYADDLLFYWQDGYGHELTYAQACPAFNDMINFLQAKSRFPKSTIYFTHSGTILKLLAHLGLYEDDPKLNSQNFNLYKDSRKWRTSLIDCFASNLAFVSFRCGNESKILTMHQEKIVRLPSCPDTDLCGIEEIKQYYLKSVQSCNFDAMCNNNEDQ